MSSQPQNLSIRAKKLGVLLRDARQTAGKSVEECAQVIGAPVDTLQAFELGELSPSLPELEMLGHFLNVPVEHFFGGSTIAKAEPKPPNYSPEQLLALRQRMIGAQLRLARIQAGLSVERLAEKSGMPARNIEQWELGEKRMSFPELEILTATLNQPLRDFQDRFGPVGVWAFQGRAMEEFLRMPLELQEFIGKPINRPYLELAVRLSEMRVDKLRGVAEGLLEITL